MYYGCMVLGFFVYFYCGFEIVIIVQKGFVDYFDLFGVMVCFGYGDVQWIIIGKGL